MHENLQPRIEINPASELRMFYDNNPWAKYQSVLDSIDLLEKKDPKFLIEVLESTKDLRELSNNLQKHAFEKISKSGIELVSDPEAEYTFGLSTSPGIKGNKLNAPNFLNDSQGYERYVEAQMNKTPFDGLNLNDYLLLLESYDELGDADLYNRLAHNYQFRLLNQRAGLEQVKEQGNMDIILRIKEKVLPLNMLMALLNGKLGKLKHAPRFALDKLKGVLDYILKL